MAIQYAGGSRVNYTFTDAGTRADLVSKLNTQLKNAGWSVISGDGTGDVLMKSAVTPDGLSVQLRLYDPGSGNCARFTLKNNAGTLTSQVFYLLPASVDWRIIANKYQFFMFRVGAVNRIAARSILYGGTIWVPSFVLTAMGGDLDCGFLQGTGDSDTSTSTRTSFRESVVIDTAVSYAMSSTLYTSFMLNPTTGDQSHDHPILLPPSITSSIGARTSQGWQDGSAHLIEALVGWSPDNSTTSRAVLKGQLWDAMVGSKPVAGESTITFDGHTFLAITDQGRDSAKGIGTLYVAVD